MRCSTFWRRRNCEELGSGQAISCLRRPADLSILFGPAGRNCAERSSATDPSCQSDSRELGRSDARTARPAVGRHRRGTAPRRITATSSGPSSFNGRFKQFSNSRHARTTGPNDVSIHPCSPANPISCADPEPKLPRALGYLDAQLRPKDGIPGRRVFIGEYGFPADRYAPQDQDALSRRVMRIGLGWGCPSCFIGRSTTMRSRTVASAGFG